MPYIDETDINNPKCTSACPDGSYIDTLTYTNKIVCVKSCKNLIPVAFVDAKDVNKKKCTRTCPSNVPNLI